MLKTYVKYLLLMTCLPYVYSAQASEERTTVLFQGLPAHQGMNPLRRENLQQPSLFKTYHLPALTGGLASLAGAGFALQDTHQWAPYVGWGSGTLAAILLAKKLLNLSNIDNAQSIYAPLLWGSVAGSAGGYLIGGLLGKLLQNRELNPYALAAIAGAGALCGIGAQYRMPHAIQSEQELGGENVPSDNESVKQPIIRSFIAKMAKDDWRESKTADTDDNDQQKAQAWRIKALQELSEQLSERQRKLLQKAYHRQQIVDILRGSSEAHLNELAPEILRDWIMWASHYYKTVPEKQWLAMVKKDLSEHKNWFNRNGKDFTDVFNFIMQLQDAQRLNQILDEVSNERYDPLIFLQKMRDLKKS